MRSAITIWENPDNVVSWAPLDASLSSFLLIRRTIIVVGGRIILIFFVFVLISFFESIAWTHTTPCNVESPAPTHTPSTLDCCGGNTGWAYRPPHAHGTRPQLHPQFISGCTPGNAPDLVREARKSCTFSLLVNLMSSFTYCQKLCNRMHIVRSNHGRTCVRQQSPQEGWIPSARRTSGIDSVFSGLNQDSNDHRFLEYNKITV